MLRARLYERELKKREGRNSPTMRQDRHRLGPQIRYYVLSYKMVKGTQPPPPPMAPAEPPTRAVLDGDLDQFMAGELARGVRRRAGGGRGCGVEEAFSDSRPTDPPSLPPARLRNSRPARRAAMRHRDRSPSGQGSGQAPRGLRHRSRRAAGRDPPPVTALS